MGAPDAIIQIPEMEFEIGASEKRQLDAIFNHISNAMSNLTQHARQNFVTSETKEKVLDCIEQLSKLLDIEHPWELVVRDPSGRSIFKPADGVEIIDEGAAAATTAPMA